MEFDIWLPTATPFATPELLAAVARQCEERAVATVWVGEHVVTFDAYGSHYPYADNGKFPMPEASGLLDPLTALTFLAAVTETVRLGTAMCLLPQRHPVYTAKEVATLDWLSGGRVDLGVGVGWLREEFEALGVPWARRGARTDEYLDVLRALWGDEPSSFSGAFYELPPCTMYPKPVQVPHPPVHVGGESDAALRRVARPGPRDGTPSTAPRAISPASSPSWSDCSTRRAGREADVRVTVCPYFKPLDPDVTEQYAAAGADAVSAMLFAMSPEDVPGAFDVLDACRERALAC